MGKCRWKWVAMDIWLPCCRCDGLMFRFEGEGNCSSCGEKIEFEQEIDYVNIGGRGHDSIMIRTDRDSKGRDL